MTRKKRMSHPAKLTSPRPSAGTKHDMNIQKDSTGRVLLKSLPYPDFEKWVMETLGEKKYRAKQLWTWIYRRHVSSFDEMTDVSKRLRTKLHAIARIDVLEVDEIHKAADGTRKITFKLDSGAIIESVLIPTEKRNTLCISSQVGCAMNCQFCLTAKMGLREQLTTAEIIDQVVQVRRLFEEEQHVSNIVFMGMGEPLHNVDNVIPASKILLHDSGLCFSRRKVTVSTSGLVPEIRRLGQETDVRLAVSLNATTNETRDWLMPVNRKHPIEELIAELKHYPLRKGDRITFEYVLLAGVNDSIADARRIVRLLSNLPAKVNLIPFNPHPGTEFRRATPESVIAFQEFLVSKHFNATIRETRGDDGLAACGQLGKPGEKRPKRMEVPEGFETALKPAAERVASSE